MRYHICKVKPICLNFSYYLQPSGRIRNLILDYALTLVMSKKTICVVNLQDTKLHRIILKRTNETLSSYVARLGLDCFWVYFHICAFTWLLKRHSTSLNAVFQHIIDITTVIILTSSDRLICTYSTSYTQSNGLVSLYLCVCVQTQQNV